MYLVQIAFECAPVAKVGGLGDEVFGLNRESEVIAARGAKMNLSQLGDSCFWKEKLDQSLPAA